MPVKKTTDIKRIYFIIPDELNEKTLKILNENKMSFVDKIYISKTPNSLFINMTLNINIDDNDTFKRLAKKINILLNSSYKIFYKDNSNRFTYIDEKTLNENKNALHLFINDD